MQMQYDPFRFVADQTKGTVSDICFLIRIGDLICAEKELEKLNTFLIGVELYQAEML